jgi:hypothetical protein
MPQALSNAIRLKNRKTSFTRYIFVVWAMAEGLFVIRGWKGDVHIDLLIFSVSEIVEGGNVHL